MLSLPEMAVLQSVYILRYDTVAMTDITALAVKKVGDSRFSRESALKMLGALREDGYVRMAAGNMPEVTERGLEELAKSIKKVRLMLSMAEFNDL